MSEFLGIGWQYPFDVGKKDEGHYRLAKAAYEESVSQAIKIILGTAKGERVMRRDFGCDIHELIFAPNDAATRGLAASYVHEALLRWEPRIELIQVQVEASGEYQEALYITIEYSVRTTDNRFNIVYPFYLNRSAT